MHIQRVIVMVSDMERSIAFYRDTLQLPLTYESPHWSEFTTGHCTLALHIAAFPSEAMPPKRAGSLVICLSVSSLENYCARLQARGISVERPSIKKGMDVLSASVVDPDGVTIQFEQQ